MSKSKTTTKKSTPSVAKRGARQRRPSKGKAEAPATPETAGTDAAELVLAQPAATEAGWVPVEAESATATARGGRSSSKSRRGEGARAAGPGAAEDPPEKRAEPGKRRAAAAEPGDGGGTDRDLVTAVDRPLAVEGPDAPRTDSLPPMEQVIADLAKHSVAELVKLHVEQLGRRPKIKSRVWLQRKLAWHEQTRRFGGLSGAAKKRLEELMGEIQLPLAVPRAPKSAGAGTRSADDLPLGTRLERTWHGRVIVATRVEGGWSCEGHTFKSLSAAAKAVSGSHVSGPAFFGIWKPKEATQ